MKKLFLTAAVVAQTAFIFAQTPAIPADTVPRLKIYGNVRVDAYYNTRQMEEGSDGFVLLYPKPENIDANGNDLNGNGMAGITATGSRFGLDFAPFRVKKLNMNLSGRIEADFQGFSSSATLLRIRHAWMKMNFGKSDVLAGQTWHPFYDNCYPNVLDLNGGQPYQPFARNPQVRYSYSTNGVKLYGAALYQTQFTSPGPEGRSTAYQRNAKIPELVAGVDYKISSFTVGAAAEYKQLQPRNIALKTVDGAIAVDEKVQSTAFNAYVQYSQKLLTLKAKAAYGQNLSDMCMLGGYAATDSTAQGERSYKPFDVITGWFSADYKLKENSPWNFNLFAGYSKNLGCDHSVLGTSIGSFVYGNVMYGGKMLSEVWRGSAQVSYKLPNWCFSLEYSYNKAFYGTLDTTKGEAIDNKGIDGSRVLAVAMFMF